MFPRSGSFALPRLRIGGYDEPGMLRVSDDIVVRDSEIEERFIRSSGPGGQNVNKVSTAVELRYDVEGSSLPAAVKRRLAALSGSRLTADGVLVIEAREHRTQKQNREAARRRLVELVARAARPPKPRRATRPTASSREQRLREKRRRARVKAGRRAEPDE